MNYWLMKTEPDDVFQYLSRHNEPAWDMIAVDPPALIKAQRNVEAGRKAYFQNLGRWLLAGFLGMLFLAPILMLFLCGFATCTGSVSARRHGCELCARWTRRKRALSMAQPTGSRQIRRSGRTTELNLSRTLQPADTCACGAPHHALGKSALSVTVPSCRGSSRSCRSLHALVQGRRDLVCAIVGDPIVQRGLDVLRSRGATRVETGYFQPEYLSRYGFRTDPTSGGLVRDLEPGALASPGI